jgi:hypothetical protein
VAPRPVAVGVPARGPIVVDGRLDEAAWADAAPISGFIQAEPDPGHPATEETEVRILYDDTYLYIGATCYDRAPDRLVSGTLERDHPGVSAHHIDLFAVFLDTFRDRRNGFLFLVNPAGAVRDGQIFDNSRNMDFAWDAVVHVATTIHEEGWTVEMAIPWTTLRFDPSADRQVWGVNFHRSISRRGERTLWAPLDRRHQVHFAERAGTLEGPTSVPHVRNLRVKPFVVAQDGRGEALVDWQQGTTWDGGMDLKYGITPRLTLDAAWRADFSHVEVDQQQVNLSRFPILFPERRDFFVENSGTFVFGDQTERNYRSGASLSDFRLFHSRRIGLEGGRPVPLDGGIRLTGQMGETEVGLLHARTGAVESMPGEAFSILRLRRQVGGSSDVGMLLTDRKGRPALRNRAAGVDANVRAGPHLVVSSYLARTDGDASEGDPWAGRIWLGWRDRLWDLGVMNRRIGAGFDPGVGFVRRRNIHHRYATVGAHPRPGLPGVLDLNPYVELHEIRAPGEGLETREGEVGLVARFLDGGDAALSLRRRHEVLDQGFPVEGQLFVPEGVYTFYEGSARYGSSQNRSLSAGVTLAGGGFFGGTRRTLQGSLRWAPSPHLSNELSFQRNALGIDGTSASANLYGVRTRVAWSTRLYLGGVLQYNQAQEQWLTNLRLTFLHAPLSEFYLVLADRRGVGDLRSEAERLVSLKFTRLLAF